MTEGMTTMTSSPDYARGYADALRALTSDPTTPEGVSDDYRIGWADARYLHRASDLQPLGDERARPTELSGERNGRDLRPHRRACAAREPAHGGLDHRVRLDAE